jgi:hypothetical protein
MTLSEIYDLAKHTPDYPEFEQLVKSELTGLPYTQVIDCEVEIRVKETHDDICQCKKPATSVAGNFCGNCKKYTY